MTDILSLIDGALGDYQVSRDAMRWTPDDPLAEEPAPVAPVATRVAWAPAGTDPRHTERWADLAPYVDDVAIERHWSMQRLINEAVMLAEFGVYQQRCVVGFDGAADTSAAYIDERAWTDAVDSLVEEIAARAGVPMHVLGGTGDETLERIRRAFAVDWPEPLTIRLTLRAEIAGYVGSARRARWAVIRALRRALRTSDHMRHVRHQYRVRQQARRRRARR